AARRAGCGTGGARRADQARAGGGDRTGDEGSSQDAGLNMIDLSKLRALDVHVHADVAGHEPEDPVMGRFFDAASAYFKAPRERPRIPEIISLYREQQIAFCLCTVDCESSVGARRVSNYEIAEYAAKNDDIVIPFASIDPRRGKM